MSLLLSGPLEILSRVFQSCDDFNDVLGLAMSCKHMNSIWLSESGYIIWEVGRSSILSFDEALITVRATDIVHSAHKAGKLPREISIPSLSGIVQKPTIRDLKSTLDFCYFVRYLEHEFLSRKKTETSFGRGSKHLLDDSPHLLLSLQENFHRAVYRFFIAGAVLSRAYQEPLYTRSDIPLYNFLGFAKHMVESASQSDHPDDQIDEIPIGFEETEYLTKHFPVYDFTPRSDWENCFGHLGEWLLGETRQRLSCEQDPVTKLLTTTNGRGHAVLREVMQLLAMFGQLLEVEGGILNSNKPFWKQHWRGRDGRCICLQDLLNPEIESDEEEDEDHESEEEIVDDIGDFQGRKHRVVPVVFFGIFEPCDIKILAEKADFDDFTPIEYDYLEPNLVEAPQLPHIPIIGALCKMLWCQSGRANTVNGHPSPHPPLHFFTFLLRKYFGYQFNELAFEMDSPKPIYESFIRGGKIFTEEGDWEDMLTSVNPKQDFSYLSRGWSEYSHR